MRHTLGRKSLIFFADQPDFQQNNVTDIESEGTGGVTESFRQRVVMPFTGIYNDTHHVLGHELVHVFQYDISNNTPGGAQGFATLPLWLVEGMAEYLSLGRSDVNTATWLRDAARRNDVPTIRQLTNDPRYFPYRYGQALWAYVGGRYGDQAVVDVFRNSLRVGFEQAIRRTLDVSSAQLSKDWADAIKGAYLPLIAGRQVPTEVGTNVVLQKSKRGGEYNIGPALSPDGRTVAFFSSRGLFGVDLYLADAETGRVIRQLGSINSPRHFDALSFINTSGAWSPDGRQFVHVVYRGGDQVLAVYDVANRREARVLRTPGIGAAVDPTWSPDGRTIAFVGMKGGLSDLYVYDLASNAVTQLTADRLAQLQPHWSPDGRTLAFATDQGPGTDLDSLAFAPTRIATLDVASRRVTILPGFPGARHINPQWAPDGRSVYFIADPDGFSDVYRQDLATSERFRLTRTATGVSGITNLSPALTVARQTGRVLFSVFDRQGYNLVRLDGDRTVGTPVTGANTGTAVAAGGTGSNAQGTGAGVGGTGAGSVPGTTPTTAASSSSGNSGGEGGVLPPAGNVRASVIEGYLADAGTGLVPADTAFSTARLSSRLGLNYVAPPTLGAGYNQVFGAGVQGGIAALFGDQLNNQQVVAVVQAQGQVQDIGGQVQYINTGRRLNFGAGAGHIPIPIGFVNLTQNADNANLVNYNQNIVRITVDQAFGLTQYPLNQTQRFEFTGGFTRQSVSGQRFVTVLDQNGNVRGQYRERIRGSDFGARANNSAQVSAAFVGDYSIFGLTSPIAGGRYRFEVTPNFIDQRFTQLTADYRRYLFFRPVTFAVRGLHLGRYGGNSDSLSSIASQQNFSAVQPLYVGFPTLVRGYDVYSGSFRANECGAAQATPTGQQSCPAFQRLFGSRVAVANAEFRIPLLGPAGLGIIPTNVIPLDIVPFADAGLAWTGGQPPSLRFVTGDEARNTTARIPVFSAGVSARMNLLGFAIVEAFYAKPFQRPDRVNRGVFGFQLAPGW
jgi:Tol biopolymer transport system component